VYREWEYDESHEGRLAVAAAIDLSAIAIGAALMHLIGLVRGDRRRSGTGLIAVGCYGLLLPAGYGLAAHLSWNRFDADGNGLLLVLCLPLVPLVSIPVGLSLLDLPAGIPAGCLLPFNAVGLLLEAVMLFVLLPNSGEGGLGVLMLAGALAAIILFIDLLALIGLLVAGFSERYSRGATSKGLFIGSVAAATETTCSKDAIRSSTSAGSIHRCGGPVGIDGS
jgi:hypothetical protein